MKTEFSRQIFEKYSNIKFRENSSVGAQLFHADGQADMTKLIIAFRNSANAPKKEGRKERKRYNVVLITQESLGKVTIPYLYNYATKKIRTWKKCRLAKYHYK